MIAGFCTDILQLPRKCLVSKKLTKAFFYRNFELTPAETRLLESPEVVMQMDWPASIRHDNANVPAYTAEEVVVEEIIVLLIQTGVEDLDKTGRKIAELIQKYIPYHILLVVYNETHFLLNTCDKRINQNDATRRIVEAHYFTESISLSAPSGKHSTFLESLAFAGLDKQNLRTCYDAITSRIAALQAATLRGGFTVRTKERTIQDVVCLERIAHLEAEVEILRNRAKKETQLSVQIALNAEIQGKRKEIAALKGRLTDSG